MEGEKKIVLARGDIERERLPRWQRGKKGSTFKWHTFDPRDQLTLPSLPGLKSNRTKPPSSS
jgi:hypothetical protein